MQKIPTVKQDQLRALREADYMRRQAMNEAPKTVEAPKKMAPAKKKPAAKSKAMKKNNRSRGKKA